MMLERDLRYTLALLIALTVGALCNACKIDIDMAHRVQLHTADAGPIRLITDVSLNHQASHGACFTAY